MKASTKYSVAGILSLSLFLFAFMLYSTATAQMDYEKVILGEDRIRIQTALGQPILDVTLVDNTDQCLADCFAILEFTPHQDITTPASENGDFRWEFIKAGSEMDGLKSYHFEILEEVPYSVRLPVIGNQSYSCILDNATEEKGTCWRESVTGYKEVTKYKEEYRKFGFWGTTFEEGRRYYMKLVGKKKPSLKSNDIDWIPSFFGVKIDEWKWWNSSWGACRNITIDHDKISSDLTDFPLLLALNDSKIDYDTTQSSGQDLRIVDAGCRDDGSIVPYEIELWNESGSSYVWFKANISSSKDTVYSYYYGNDYAEDNQQNTDVWDPNFKAVYHMNDYNTSVSNDSTVNGYHGTKKGDNEPSENTGKIGFAQDFDGTDDYLSITKLGSFGSNMDEPFTIEMWINTSQETKDNILGSVNDADPPANTRLMIMLHSSVTGDDQDKVYIYIGDESNDVVNANPTNDITDIADGTWHYLVFVVDASRNSIGIFFDGVSQSPITYDYRMAPDNFANFQYPMFLGAVHNKGTPMNFLDVDIDEVRFGKTDFSSDWINASYLAMTDQLIDYGDKEQEIEIADEEDGDSAIMEGICNVLSGDNTYPDQKIYIRYSDGEQKQGAFDWVALSGNQTWAFNYVTSNDSTSNWTNMANLTNVVYIWENNNMTSTSITESVASFINGTKV